MPSQTSVFKAAVACAVVAAACAATNFIPAASPSIQYQGRTRINDDGTRTFDWEGTQILLNVQDASYVKLLMNSTGAVSRFRGYINGYDATTVYISSEYNAVGYIIALGLPSGINAIRVYNLLEPAFESVGSGELTFVGFQTDGSAAPASPQLTRNIEFVGDSITVGFGSAGYGPCPASMYTNDNSRTYDAYLGANFTANTTVIAWSGTFLHTSCAFACLLASC